MKIDHFNKSKKGNYSFGAQHGWILLCALLLTSCMQKAYVFTSFQEPANEGLRLLVSKDGRHWKRVNRIFLPPSVGSQKIMRDPSFVQGRDGVFHLVWTTAWRGDLGFGYASSKDLLNWSTPRFIPVMEKEPETVNVWAPEIMGIPQTDSFLIVWASTIPHRFPKGQEEEKNNHRLYSTTTKDFQTFTPTRLFYDPGWSAIDAVLVPQKLPTGKFAMVVKNNTRPARNIAVSFSNSFQGPYGETTPAFSAHLTEGPTVLRLKKYWYIFFDAYGGKNYQAVKTKDFISFQPADAECSFPEDHKHGTAIPISKKHYRKLVQFGVE